MFDALGNYIGDDGLDAPVKPLDRTQATSPNVPAGVNNGINNKIKAVPKVNVATIAGAGFGTGVSEFGDDPPLSPTDAGAGATDDGTTAGIQETINQSNQATGPAVSGQVSSATGYFQDRPNILDNFASYTYRASVYLMSPEQYRALILSKKKVTNGYMLLFQSGGAPTNTTGFMGGLNQGNQNYAAGLAAGAGEDPATQAALQAGTTTIPGANQKDAGRNPAFPNDFYIDSITMETLAPGPGTRAAHSVKSLKFTVIEPANITLLDCLEKAVQDFIPNNGKKVNWSSPSYLMVLRWYGYDAKGNLIPGITGADPNSVPSDSNAVIEKFIPFRIKTVNWGVSGKLVSYDFDCLSAGVDIGAGTRRGTVPYDLELNSSTVGKLLGGDLTYSSNQAQPANPGGSTTVDARGRQTAASDPRVQALQQSLAPPKADAAPGKKTVASGLMAAMTQFQEELVKQQKYETADTYKITFLKGPDGAPSIENASIVPPGGVEKGLTPMTPATSTSAASLDQSKQSVNGKAKNQAIVAGQQIVQVIDQTIRNSTYILDQALTVEVDGEQQLNPKKLGATVYWYNITMNATPKEPYDNLRNDFAYDIEFVVTPYVLQDFSSKFFPISKFLGVHKSYNYWFTGKNTAVIDYKETLNNAYNITISGANPKDSQVEKQRRLLEMSMRDQPFYSFMSASSESRQGSDSKDYEPGANAAEYLYDPKGLANCSLRIIGDPAWIQQGSAAGGISAASFSYGPFLADGTINYDYSQVMFEIAWQRPEDYDLATGLADPYKGAKRQPVQTRTYTVKKVVSEFKQGKFEQTLEGKLYNFPKSKNPNNKSVNSPAPVNSGTNAGFGSGVSEFGEDPRPPESSATAGNAVDNTSTRNTVGTVLNNAADTGALATAATKAAPTTLLAPTTSQDSSAMPLPPTPNTGPQPQSPPAPATSNGAVVNAPAEAPPKLAPANTDESVTAAPTSNNQLLAQDDR